MSPLSASLIQKGIVSQKDVERAQARQVLYGGDLFTNLLEVARPSEKALIECAAEVLGIPAAAAGELQRVDQELTSTMPGDLALRLGIYPIARNANSLGVAVSEQLTDSAKSELQALLGVSVTERVTLAVRIRQAICRDFGLPLDRRSQRAIAKLEGLPDPMPSVSPSPLAEAPGFAALPRAPSMPPMGFGDALPPPPAVVQRAPHVATQPGIPAQSIAPAPIARPSSAFARSPAAGEQSSFGHQNGTANLKASEPRPTPKISPAESFLDQDGRETTRAPTEVEALQVVASVTEKASAEQTKALHSAAEDRVRPPAARKERRTTKRHRGPYTPADIEQDLRAAGSTSEVLGAFFDFSAQYFDYSALFAVHGDIAEGRDANGPGLDRSKITAIGVPLDIPSLMSRARDERQFTLSRLSQTGLDASLARDLKRPLGRTVLVMPVAIRGRAVLLFYGDNGRDDVALADVGEVLAITPLVSASLERILRERKRAALGSAPTASKGGGAPMPRPLPKFAPPPAVERARALASALELAPELGQENTREEVRTSPPHRMKSIPAAPGGSAPHQLGTSEPARVQLRDLSAGHLPALHPTQELPTFADGRPRRGDDIVEDDWEIPEDPMPANPSLRPMPRSALTPAQGNQVSRFAASSSPAHNASAKARSGRPATPHASGTPAAVKRERQETDSLLSRALAGDAQAEDHLVDLGVNAIASVIREFPGPITRELSKDGKASDSGPILRVLARLGEQAAPFVVVRTGDSDPNVRRWATLLLGEMPNLWGLQAICKRLLDEEAEVRRAALRAAAQLIRDRSARLAFIDAMGSVLLSNSILEDDRLVMIHAIAELKLGEAVPLLLHLLDGSSAERQSAEWALGVLTCQEFPTGKPAWEQWWTANSRRHRGEWLIDALTHSSTEIRDAAHEELRLLSGQDFGYRETAPREKLIEIQARYREWWQATAKR